MLLTLNRGLYILEQSSRIVKPGNGNQVSELDAILVALLCILFIYLSYYLVTLLLFLVKKIPYYYIVQISICCQDITIEPGELSYSFEVGDVYSTDENARIIDAIFTWILSCERYWEYSYVQQRKVLGIGFRRILRKVLVEERRNLFALRNEQIYPMYQHETSNKVIGAVVCMVITSNTPIKKTRTLFSTSQNLRELLFTIIEDYAQIQTISVFWDNFWLSREQVLLVYPKFATISTCLDDYHSV